MTDFFGNLPACVIRMEASGGAHSGRVLSTLGHRQSDGICPDFSALHRGNTVAEMPRLVRSGDHGEDRTR